MSIPPETGFGRESYEARKPFRDLALKTTASIGDGLVRTAIWSGRRCTWMGAEPMEGAKAGPGWEPATRLTYRALGPDLYSGSGGVGLYLAELAAATGQTDIRRTAVGALRHALSRHQDVEPTVRAGYYIGWSGIAVAALRVGSLLHDPELAERGHDLLGELARNIGAKSADGSPTATSGQGGSIEFDLIAGTSGAVLALLEGYRLVGADGLLNAAWSASDQLLKCAKRRAVGWSWQTPRLGNRHDLTGLSHGAAGVATALIEAYRATGDEAFAAGAREAMRYEDHWFDLHEKNWPDFRPSAGGNNFGHDNRAFATLWCHGAPGIALARRHAYRYLGDTQWLEDFQFALHTTMASTSFLLSNGGGNFSLCHGLAGNAECMTEAGPGLGSTNEGSDMLVRVARYGIDEYAAKHLNWPCGTHTGPTPNLMLGLAGVGYFYLRCAIPHVRSVLLPVYAANAAA